MSFHGFNNGLSDLSRLSDAVSRSITPENPRGLPGGGGRATLEEGSAADAARQLGVGWKVNPYRVIEAGEVVTIAEIEGPGAIQHIWMTPTGVWRHTILRIYWDDQAHPSVEVPLGDFFLNGWNRYAPVSSLPITVNPGSAFNSYFTMPFHKRCRMTIENLDHQAMVLYYQIDYALGSLSKDVAYFHASFRRINPLPKKAVYPIIDGIEGRGHYVGTYLAWGSNSNGWWGEGEVKFYLDDDEDFPTICGTGTEDYFCGSYNFENPMTKQYETYTNAYAGFHQVIKPDGLYQSQTRFGMYRFHIVDPIRFKSRLKVTVQALGWRKDRQYLPLQDDIASVAYWYQTLPSKPFKPLPSLEALEII